MTDVLDLIARLEKAEGGSRELDAEILASLGTHVLEKRGRDQKEWWYPVDGPSYNRLNPSPHSCIPGEGIPRYTTSLDAALTLVPEGLDPMVWRSGKTWFAQCRSSGDIAVGGRRHAPTPALALCIAAIRARLPVDVTSIDAPTDAVSDWESSND